MAVATLIPRSLFVGYFDRSHFLTLGLIFVEQFVAVFCPVVTRMLAFMSIISGGPNAAEEEEEDLLLGGVSIEKGKSSKSRVVHGSYSRFLDDKKPSLASKSDVQKLKAIGYEKYRFVSKEFIARYTDSEGLVKGPKNKLEEEEDFVEVPSSSKELPEYDLEDDSGGQQQEQEEAKTAKKARNRTRSDKRKTRRSRK